MNIHISNTAGYHGSVGFKLSVGGKEYSYKNSGTAELFRLFARALSGWNVSADTPFYIDGDYTIGVSTTKIKFLKIPLYITARAFVDDSDGGITRFTATLLPSDLINIPVSSTGVTYKFHLLMQDKQTELATIQIDDNTIFDNIPSTARIIIEWSMSVRNN